MDKQKGAAHNKDDNKNRNDVKELKSDGRNSKGSKDYDEKEDEE